MAPAKLYPARVRTSGFGWAMGVGRIGSVVEPMPGGYLLSIGLQPTQIFLSACFIALIAAVATALLALPAAPVGHDPSRTRTLKGSDGFALPSRDGWPREITISEIYERPDGP
jgi:hypothetical protein